mgnify:CR=1 FL=1
MPAGIDAITRTDIQTKLDDAVADGPPITQKPGADPLQTHFDPRARPGVTEFAQPHAEWRYALRSHVAPQLNGRDVHDVAYKLQRNSQAGNRR